MTDDIPLSTVHQVLAQIQAANAELVAALNGAVPGVQMTRVLAALARGASLDAVGRDRRGNRCTTVLHQAIQKRHPDLLTLLLAQGASPDEPDVAKRTPLMEAVRGLAAWAIPPLLKAGANPSWAEPSLGGTALEQALMQEYDEAVEDLAGSCPPVEGDTGPTPEPLLAQAKTARAVRALLDAGADVHWQAGKNDNLIGRVLHHTANPERNLGEQKGAEVICALIEAGAPVPPNALFWAATRGQGRLMALLDDQCLDWDAPDPELNMTPRESLFELDDTALAEHWQCILDARSQASRLSAALTDPAQVAAPCRPRL